MPFLLATVIATVCALGKTCWYIKCVDLRARLFPTLLSTVEVIESALLAHRECIELGPSAKKTKTYRKTYSSV